MLWTSQMKLEGFDFTYCFREVKFHEVQGKLVTGCFSNERTTTCEVITTHPFSSHFRCSSSKFEG
jgi:hypothetical protein